ncbi:MAG: ABC transporter ATP-binding protein, partial [Shewanella sp.]
MTSTLTLKQVHSDYMGHQVLNGLSLSVAQGEILALLGPSGCGKTTLLRAVAGLQAISQGDIQINGRIMSGDSLFVPSERRGIGMIFQDYALFPHLTVAENILFGVVKLSAVARQARLDDMLTLVKLEGLAQRYPHELSGGQQQRVSIARALAYEPQLLLLDEPFSNIDAQVRYEMMTEIRSI